MTAEARFFPRARQDLIEQAAYLTENASARVADRFLTSVEQTATRLAGMPRMGHLWRSISLEPETEIRVWKVKGFPKILIFYRPESSGISVVRVLHGARDLPPLLEGYV
jgi:toxin ParE1/3/4